MIESTDEMEQVYDEAAWEHPVELGGLEMANVRAGLKAVIAVIERDYDVTPKLLRVRPTAPSPCPFCTTGLAAHCPWHRPGEAS